MTMPVQDALDALHLMLLLDAIAVAVTLTVVVIADRKLRQSGQQQRR